MEMRLRFLQGDLGPEGAETIHECLADALINGQNAFLRRFHDDAVRYFFRVKNRTSSRRAPNDIDTCIRAFPEIDFFYILMPTERERRGAPAVDSDDRGAGTRDEGLCEPLVVPHVELAGPTTGIPELPDRTAACPVEYRP